jgi:hypothetical protein
VFYKDSAPDGAKQCRRKSNLPSAIRAACWPNTTTQLLGLLLEARTNPEKRKDLVNGLFSTVGVYQEFSDWQKVLIAPAPAPIKAK